MTIAKPAAILLTIPVSRAFRLPNEPDRVRGRYLVCLAKPTWRNRGPKLKGDGTACIGYSVHCQGAVVTGISRRRAKILRDRMRADGKPARLVAKVGHYGGCRLPFGPADERWLM